MWLIFHKSNNIFHVLLHLWLFTMRAGLSLTVLIDHKCLASVTYSVHLIFVVISCSPATCLDITSMATLYAITPIYLILTSRKRSQVRVWWRFVFFSHAKNYWTLCQLSYTDKQKQKPRHSKSKMKLTTIINIKKQLLYSRLFPSLWLYFCHIRRFSWHF